MTISNLLDDIDTLKKLASMMDRFWEKNHVRLGEWLIQNNKVDKQLKKKLKGLEKFFHGGGSPTLAFLDANSTENPNDMVSKLRECANTTSRNDVVEVLKEISEDILLKELEDSVKTEIADLLDRHVPGVVNWETFAYRFGFKHDKREVYRKKV